MIPARSYLFVPGNRCERIAKAIASGADAVIVDLEDAVPPAEKDDARAAVRASLDAARPIWLRINGAHELAFPNRDIARAAALVADYGAHVPGVQINRFCASGLDAVNFAAAQVMSGQHDMAVGGGGDQGLQAVTHAGTFITSRKFFSNACPCSERIDSGWNCTPSMAYSLCRTPMIS